MCRQCRRPLRTRAPPALPFPGGAGSAARHIPAEAAGARHRPPVRHSWVRSAEPVRATTQVTRALEGRSGNDWEKFCGTSVSEAGHGSTKPQRGWRRCCRTKEGRGVWDDAPLAPTCPSALSDHPGPTGPGPCPAGPADRQRGRCGGGGGQRPPGRDRRGRALPCKRGGAAAGAAGRPRREEAASAAPNRPGRSRGAGPDRAGSSGGGREGRGVSPALGCEQWTGRGGRRSLAAGSGEGTWRA